VREILSTHVRQRNSGHRGRVYRFKSGLPDFCGIITDLCLLKNSLKIIGRTAQKKPERNPEKITGKDYCHGY